MRAFRPPYSRRCKAGFAVAGGRKSAAPFPLHFRTFVKIVSPAAHENLNPGTEFPRWNRRVDCLTQATHTTAHDYYRPHRRRVPRRSPELARRRWNVGDISGAPVCRTQSYRCECIERGRTVFWNVCRRMGVSPQYPRGRRIQRPRLVRFEPRRRADRGTSAVVDPDRYLRESRTMADSVRNDRICRRQFRSGRCDPTYPAWPARRLSIAVHHRDLWRLLRRGHRFFNAGCFYPIRHAGHQRDERPQDGAGGYHDNPRDHHVRCGKRGARPETLPMLAGSAVGSYMAAHWAQRLDQRLIKGFVVVLGAALTIYFAWRGV